MNDPDLRVVYDQEAVLGALEGMAFDIAADNESSSDLVVVMVLKGGLFTGFGLLRHLPLYVPYGFVGLSSYKEGTEAEGGIEVTYDLDFPSDFLAGKDVWIIDDVVEEGNTLATAVDLVVAHNPRSIKTAVLVSKISTTGDKQRFRPDVFGLYYDKKKFLVGCGMGIGEEYRNLPMLCEYSPGKDQ